MKNYLIFVLTFLFVNVSIGLNNVVGRIPDLEEFPIVVQHIRRHATKYEGRKLWWWNSPTKIPRLAALINFVFILCYHNYC